MDEPNIFDFATKELSQDAFLCWIFSWGKQEYENDYSELHQFAKQMLFDITKRSDLILEDISRQEKHIDVLLKLKDSKNQNYAVIIEDKVGTQEHNTQINQYIKTIKPIYGENIYIVYFKTGFTSNQEKKRLKQRYPHIFIYGHDDIYTHLTNCPNHYILNQWFKKFQVDFKNIEDCKKNLNYKDIFYQKDILSMQCALDLMTDDIIEKSNYKNSYWYIVDKGKTPHICLYEKYSENIDGYLIHNAVYLMFRKKEYNFVVKQHIWYKEILNESEYIGNSGSGTKYRVLTKNYHQLPENVVYIKEQIKDKICSANTGWKIKRLIEKDNLMILQKSFPYTKNICDMILQETSNIEKIKYCIENFLV